MESSSHRQPQLPGINIWSLEIPIFYSVQANVTLSLSLLSTAAVVPKFCWIQWPKIFKYHKNIFIFNVFVYRVFGVHGRLPTLTTLRIFTRLGWSHSVLWVWSCGLWPLTFTLIISWLPRKRKWRTAGLQTAGDSKNWWLVPMRYAYASRPRFALGVIAHWALVWLTYYCFFLF